MPVALFGWEGDGETERADLKGGRAAYLVKSLGKVLTKMLVAGVRMPGPPFPLRGNR